MPERSLQDYSRWDSSIGIAATAQAGLFSSLAILYLLWHISCEFLRQICKGTRNTKTVRATGIGIATVVIVVYISFGLWAMADFMMKLT